MQDFLDTFRKARARDGPVEMAPEVERDDVGHRVVGLVLLSDVGCGTGTGLRHVTN